jgi:uncharacterized damage-inducible protein DinB
LSARDTVHAKCAGLSDADARRAPLPGSPLMRVSGLVSHLRWVETAWIEQTLLGGTINAPWTDDDPEPTACADGSSPVRLIS